jgi:hypothetical protein
MVRIGRKKFSWNSVKFRIGGIASERIRKIGFGEKITDELVYGAQRDGTPIGLTSGKYEPDVASVSFLVDEFYGNGVEQGIAQKLAAAAGTTGLGDIEFDMFLQLIEESVGVITVVFPTCRIVNPKLDFSEGVNASEVEVGIRVIDPIRVNGTQLASVNRGLTI